MRKKQGLTNLNVVNVPGLDKTIDIDETAAKSPTGKSESSWKMSSDAIAISAQRKPAGVAVQLARLGASRRPQDLSLNLPAPPVRSRSKTYNSDSKASTQYLQNLKTIVSDSANNGNAKASSRVISSESPQTDITLSPIAGYNVKPPCSLREAVSPLEKMIVDLKAHVDFSYLFVKDRVKDEAILKNPEAFAAVNLYTQEWDPAKESLYYKLNSILRDNTISPHLKFEKVKPYHPYLNLLMSRLTALPKFKGGIFRGISLDLRKVYVPDSIHVWWSITSCTDMMGGIKEFLDTSGPRTLLDITAQRGVRISEHSVYPSESEILLLPGTCLKVVDQLDLGNGLVAIQMKEIPSESEIAEALYNEPEAIDFWKGLSNQKFEVPLEMFCEAIMTRMKLPVVKKLLIGKTPSANQLEAYQKYWSLWKFSGGDDQTFSAYQKDEIPKSDRIISFQRFGLLLTWFGHFGKFLNELFTASQLKFFYDDSVTSDQAGTTLSKCINNSEYNWMEKDLWLIRCSPKRDFPFTISFIRPEDNETSLSKPQVSHLRIMFNPASRQYFFRTDDRSSSHESITNLLTIIQRELKLGKGVHNAKLDFFPTKQAYLYVEY